MNTQVGRFAHRQACMASFAPSLEASPDNEVDDDEDGADSSGDDEMTTSQ